MCGDVKTESCRPWAARADELDPREHWTTDFAAFREWWGEHVEERGGPSADKLHRLVTRDEFGFATYGDIAIYSALCDAFDLLAERPVAG